jgi:hypothetical protein
MLAPGARDELVRAYDASLEARMKIPWFDLSEVRTFAEGLVADLSRVRSGGVARADKTGSIAKRMERLIDQAAVFEREHRLNFYKKAQMISIVRSGLSAENWPAEDVEKIIQRLLTSPLRRTVALEPKKPA